MARLSGLASEHHPQGPGDKPRRRKGRPSKAATGMANNVDNAVAGTKRSASPSVEVSQTLHVKRTKRVEEVEDDSDDQEQLNRETSEALSRAQSQTVEYPRLRRHSFAAPAGASLDQEEEEEVTTTSTSIRRTKKERARMRMSMPAQYHVGIHDETDGLNEVQYQPLTQVLDRHSKLRIRRNGLSAEMNDIAADKKNGVRLREARKANADLHNQLQEREDRIKNLEFELEARRMADIDMNDDQTVELQHQLENAREEVNNLRASSAFAPDAPFDASSSFGFAGHGGFDSDDEDDQIPFVLPEDLNLTQDQMEVSSPIPSGFYASRAIEASQITMDDLEDFDETTHDVLGDASQMEGHSLVPDRISDKAVARYQAEVDALNHQSAELRGALRCIAIEMQNLNIVESGPHTKEIIAALRHVLEDTREEYEQLFSRSLVGVNNADFIKKIVEELKGMNEELLETTLLAEKQHKRIAILQLQYEGTLGLLAESEQKKKDLAAKLEESDAANLEIASKLADLTDRFNLMSGVADERQQELEDKEAVINGLKDELEEAQTSSERLTTALNQYRAENINLTNTVSRLEQEHAEELSELQKEHAAKVEGLQTQLDNEMADCAEAERIVVEKEQDIEKLSGEIAQMESGLDSLNENFDKVKETLELEKAARDAAEADRDTNADLVYQHANTIENLREELETLQADNEEIRTHLQSEKEQREQTEAELDASEEKLVALNQKLHDEGITANELRSKLFQVQQEKEAVVAKLQEEAETRTEEYAGRLATETERRENAERTIASLESTVVSLENSLADTQASLRQTQETLDSVKAEREETVEKLTRSLEDLRQTHNALKASSKSAIDTLQATIIDLNNELRGERNNVQDLKTALANGEAKYAELDTDKSELIAKQAKEIKSLEQRVDHEAGELLSMSNSHFAEVASLHDVIHHNKTEIDNLKTSAEQTAQAHEEQITEKDQEIEVLRTVEEEANETITELQTQLDTVDEKLRAQAADAQATIDALLETNRKSFAEQEEIALANKKRTEDTLKAVQEMREKGLHVKTTGANLRKVHKGKVSKKTEKVSKKNRSAVSALRKSSRPRDSGFVENVDDADELQAVEDEGVGA